MDAVTYPDDSVAEFINENVVPLRIAPDNPVAEDYTIRWTPALLILDKYGKEHHRAIGFFGRDEFIPLLILAIANLSFNQNEWPAAIDRYEYLLREYPKSDAAPEAVFQLGVARYKSSGDPKSLKDAYERLVAEYLDNQWTRRAFPYRLIS